MSVTEKIFATVTKTIKLNSTVAQLTKDVKDLRYEVRNLDRRLIRIETFIEMATNVKMPIKDQLC